MTNNILKMHKKKMKIQLFYNTRTYIKPKKAGIRKIDFALSRDRIFRFEVVHISKRG